MNELAYFMFWAVILFLMMRFGCGAHVIGRGHGKPKHGKGTPEGQASVAGKTNRARAGNTGQTNYSSQQKLHYYEL